MEQYHKIQSLFLRNPETNYKTLLEGQYALPEFDYLKDCPWLVEEKIDGTCIRVLWNGSKISFKGKTENAQIPARLFQALADQFYPLADLFADIFTDTEEDKPVCIYGEGFGAKIQAGGGNYRQDNGFVMFDIKIGPWWLTREAVEDCAKNLGIDVAPLLPITSLHEAVELCKQGFNSAWGNFLAEGVVAKPALPLYARNGSRVVTKIKTKDFACNR